MMPRFRACLSSLAVLPLVFACGTSLEPGDDGLATLGGTDSAESGSDTETIPATPIPEDEMPAALAGHFCQWWMDCGCLAEAFPKAELGGDLQSCTAVMTEFFTNLGVIASIGGEVYDGECAGQIRHSLSKLRCQTALDLQFDGELELEWDSSFTHVPCPLYRGVGTVGDVCTIAGNNDFDAAGYVDPCGSGTYCSSKSGPGICVSIPELIAPGLACDAINNSCVGGLTSCANIVGDPLGDVRACIDWPTAGEPCVEIDLGGGDLESLCGQHHDCQDGLCVTGPPVGSPCSRSSIHYQSCEPDSGCQNGSCESYAGLGGSCAVGCLGCINTNECYYPYPAEVCRHLGGLFPETP